MMMAYNTGVCLLDLNSDREMITAVPFKSLSLDIVWLALGQIDPL
jgi:hypothetical protein